ncbi:MAG: T9SS type A sorting domain-containing protein [Bacteroidetes bacterium]|nr:T9SS type A sorting domain-containing protein [Bacteroidota bacterium]
MKQLLLIMGFLPLMGKAQFHPAAGVAGTSAIKKDSSIIVNWAVSCKVVRGPQDISNPGAGYANVGDSSKATGAADVSSVVSLGDGGSATLTFQTPIKNLAGFDFCVFENSFDPGFLELAFVEVSSDGINFTRFPATSNLQFTVQIGPFDTSSDPSKLNNLAGKYIGGYGVPFDLQELNGVAGLNINAITHVKIIDAVGCIQNQYATYDKNNNKINDPWATPYGSSGFDLDAVGVINQIPVSVMEQTALTNLVSIINTGGSDELIVNNFSGDNLHVKIYNASGQEITDEIIEKGFNTLSLHPFCAGIYFVKISSGSSFFTKKIVKIN